MIPEVITSPAQAAALVDPAATEFNQTLADMEAYNKKKAEDTAKLAELRKQSEEKAKPILQPLQLTYKWIGTHDNCDTEPKTIMVDTESGCYATAYCLKDDKQLKSVKVVKLEVPEPIEEPILVPVMPVEALKTVLIDQSATIQRKVKK